MEKSIAKQGAEMMIEDMKNDLLKCGWGYSCEHCENALTTKCGFIRAKARVMNETDLTIGPISTFEILLNINEQRLGEQGLSCKSCLKPTCKISDNPLCEERYALRYLKTEQSNLFEKISRTKNYNIDDENIQEILR